MSAAVKHVLLERGGRVVEQAERAGVIRTLAELVAGQVTTFETDLPVGDRGTWPPQVQQAADQLLAAGGRAARGGYAQTGVLRRDGDDGVWTAFTQFASYALDASAWDARGRTVASLADQGTSAVFALTAEQGERVAALLPGWELVTLAQWRVRRRAQRRSRRGRG